VNKEDERRVYGLMGGLFSYRPEMVGKPLRMGAMGTC